MKRLSLALLGAVCGLAGVVSSASAQTLEIGATTSPIVAPVCPVDAQGSKCTIVLTQSTAYSSRSDGVSNPTTVSKSGVLVAFTVGVSELSSSASTRAGYITKLDNNYGGGPAARLTVLRRIGNPLAQRWQVAAQTQSISLLPYLGTAAQIPLINPITVVRGEVLALTTPTWAPVLDIELTASKFAYRQAHSTGCTSGTMPDFAQLRIGLMASYGCNYTGTRIEYSATEITSPATTS